jgi:hypothetical protein
MTETTLELADVECLAATLDAVDLDDKDRATLHAIFALAGQATAGQSDEVSGFSIVYQMPGSGPGQVGIVIQGSFLDSFQWGVGRAERPPGPTWAPEKPPGPTW